MLSNAYVLAKFRFDTAENELAKTLQKFATFANFASPKLTPAPAELWRSGRTMRPAAQRPRPARADSSGPILKGLGG